MSKFLIIATGLLFSVAAYAASVEVITSNNATIGSSSDIALLDYDQVTSGLATNVAASVSLPEGSEGQVIEVKITNQSDQDHNINLLPSGMDQIESEVGLDTMATSPGSARRLFFKSGKWFYLTYM